MITSLVTFVPSSAISLMFKQTPTTEIYTLSLHDALPIWTGRRASDVPRDRAAVRGRAAGEVERPRTAARSDRKSTRLNSSHRTISYAVFCLKKKNLILLIVSAVIISASAGFFILPLPGGY